MNSILPCSICKSKAEKTLICINFGLADSDCFIYECSNPECKWHVSHRFYTGRLSNRLYDQYIDEVVEKHRKYDVNFEQETWNKYHKPKCDKPLIKNIVEKKYSIIDMEL